MKLGIFMATFSLLAVQPVHADWLDCDKYLRSLYDDVHPRTDQPDYDRIVYGELTTAMFMNVRYRDFSKSAFEATNADEAKRNKGVADDFATATQMILMELLVQNKVGDESEKACLLVARPK